MTRKTPSRGGSQSPGAMGREGVVEVGRAIQVVAVLRADASRTPRPLLGACLLHAAASRSATLKVGGMEGGRKRGVEELGTLEERWSSTQRTEGGERIKTKTG